MTTATTPSSASARLVSMDLMRAWGYCECRIFPTSMPGTLRSSVYLPLPVVFSAASTIAVGFPMIENSVILLFRSPLFRTYCPLLFCGNRRPNRLVHLAVTGAAAQIAAQGHADFSLRRIRILGQERLHCHHEAGSAKAALRSTPVAVRFLDRRQTAMLAYAFDS